MNRPIKFRAWDGKTMMQDGNIVLDIAPDGSLRMFGDDKEVMQFTGLLDKNGKEIYEGDVVSVKNGVTGEHLQNGIVKWYPAFFDIEVAGKMHCVDAGVFERSEIIGNIYENPELINN